MIRINYLSIMSKPKDKKMRAILKKQDTLAEEIDLRLQEQKDYFNTE